MEKRKKAFCAYSFFSLSKVTMFFEKIKELVTKSLIFLLEKNSHFTMKKDVTTNLPLINFAMTNRSLKKTILPLITTF
jgi:hypothetical protein